MKIGIITQYYRSENYGGNLQAFALCYSLRKIGYDAEQICYGSIGLKSNQIENEKATLKSRIKRFLSNPKALFSAVAKRLYNRIVLKNREKRTQAFRRFNFDVIPHSEKAYTKNDVYKCNEIYDVFITGSDQVWNVKWYNPVYFLRFAQEEKIKLSYAASISKLSLTDDEKILLKENINNYLAVSVREKSAVDLLKGVVDNVHWCLDPTLLLSCKEWDEIATERIEKDKYILGFYISGNKKFRSTAKKFAFKKGIKYIEIPVYEKNFHFLNKRMYDVGPAEFLSLIKYADYVFTDSFHASVFSIIFNREFFVFTRTDHPEMSTRLTDLTDMFGCSERICDNKNKYKFKYLDNIKGLDYINKSEKYQYMKEKSIAFLKENLNKASIVLNKNEN